MITQALAATMGIIAVWQTLVCLQCIKKHGPTHRRSHTERQIFMSLNTQRPFHSSLGKSRSWGGLFRPVAAPSPVAKRNMKHWNLVKQTMQNANAKVLFEGGLQWSRVESDCNKLEDNKG